MNNLVTRFLTASVLWGCFYAATFFGFVSFCAFFSFFLAWAAVFEWPILTRSWMPLAQSVLGVVYLGLPLLVLGHMYVSYRAENMMVVLYPVLAALVCDSAAYFVGRFFGRHYVFPLISPKKTYEGLIAGYGAVILFHIYLASYHPGVSGYLGLFLKYSIVSGFFVASMAILGDVSVSALKRRAGIKDSGSLFPGHGGVLDRGGSVIFLVLFIGIVMLFGGA